MSFGKSIMIVYKLDLTYKDFLTPYISIPIFEDFIDCKKSSEHGCFVYQIMHSLLYLIK